MNPDVDDLIDRAAPLPHGPLKSELLEEAIRRCDDDDLAFQLRLALVDSYCHGGEPRKLMVPLSWCISRFDAEPERFGEHEHELLWALKYVPETLIAFPEVDLGMALSTLDDMEQRFQRGGHSLNAVHQRRHEVARHMGDAEAAAEYYRLWVTSPEDDLADCAGCGPTEQVDYLISVGRLDDAARLGDQVLEGRWTCAEQPHRAQSRLLDLYMRQGRLADAAAAHRAAYPKHRLRPEALQDVAFHLTFLARAGQPSLAREILLTHLPLLEHADSTNSEMQFCAAAALVDRIVGESSAPAGEPGWAERALTLARRYDERNGSATQTENIRRIIEAEPYGPTVALTPTEERVATLTAGVPSSVGSSASVEAPTPVLDPATLGAAEALDHAEHLATVGRFDEAAAARERFNSLVPEADRTALDTLRVRELDIIDRDRLGDLSDQDAAAATYAAIAADYTALGETVRADRASGRQAMTLGMLGRFDEAVALADQQIRRLAEGPTADAGRWRVRWGQILISAGRVDDAAAAVAPLAVADVDLLMRFPLLSLQADLALAVDDLPTAVDTLAEAVRHTSDPEQLRGAHWLRGRVLLYGLDDPAAVDDLLEASAWAVVAPGPGPWIDLDLARALTSAQRLDDAAVTVESAISGLLAADDRDATAAARFLACDLYDALDDTAAALRQIDLLLDAAQADDETPNLGHLVSRRGRLLMALERHDEARTAITSALEVTDPGTELAFTLHLMRLLAAASEAPLEVLDQAQALLPPPTTDTDIEHHRAGIDLDRSGILLRNPDTHTEALAAAQRAEAVYLSYGDRAGAALALELAVDAGLPIELDILTARWREAQDLLGPRGAAGLGWSLHARLSAAERTAEAEELAGELVALQTD